jgi:hypothetical protein
MAEEAYCAELDGEPMSDCFLGEFLLKRRLNEVLVRVSAVISTFPAWEGGLD